MEEYIDSLIREITKDIILGERFSRCESEEELLRVCKEHQKQFETPKKSDNTIILTHPFFTHIYHTSYLKTEERKKEFIEYHKTLNELIAFKKNNKDFFNLIFLEDERTYGFKTNKLLEQKLIDRVIFTKTNKGFTRDNKDLQEYENDNLYLGGMYNTLCLLQSISDMRTMHCKGDHKGEIVGIKDLTLNSPKEYLETLIPKNMSRINYGSKYLHLTEFKTKINHNNLAFHPSSFAQ